MREQNDSRPMSNAEQPSGARQQPSVEPLRSVHTSTFPQLLRQLGVSVLVTTYQAGKLVVLRAENDVLNTHFRILEKPMGLAVDVNAGRLAIGTETEVWEFHDVPAICSKLEPPGHDACFLPRRSHTTGDIQIHEMAWVDGELWFANTAFSCLCTRSDAYSFKPRWRPKFVSALAPGDRCHLNGLCTRDGKLRYVTALGQTDQTGQWRENKRNGGVLIDVPSDEIVASGLSMPHSPRWYNGKLWVLQSGLGSIGTIDESDGSYLEVARFPGFTRGLSFHGPFAFVGLSQVRESAVFSDFPVVERLSQGERTCGVWVINIETGDTVAFVRFEDALQEIFAVEVLPGIAFPDLLNEKSEMLSRAYVLDDQSLVDVPREMVTNERGDG